MRIGLDVRPSLREETGVGVYIRNLVERLARIDRSHEYFLFSSSWKDRFPASAVPPLPNVRLKDFRLPVRAVNFLWQELGWPPLDVFAGGRLDLTHSPTPLILPTRGRTVVTVCDLFFLDDPEKADAEARRVFVRKAEKSLRAADGVLTISRFTRAAVLDRFGLDADKVEAALLGVGGDYSVPPAREDLEQTQKRLGLPSEFVLFVGAVEPRKNLPGLIEAMRIIRDRGLRAPLVIAGREGGDSGRVRERIAARGLEDRIFFAGYVSDTELRHLYRLARLLVVPSFLEGFGLPLAEAMASELPAAVSAAGALPEVGGDAPLYFDPVDIEGMAEAVSRLYEDETLRRDRIAAGRARAAELTWDRTAAATLAFYKRIVGGG